MYLGSTRDSTNCTERRRRTLARCGSTGSRALLRAETAANAATQEYTPKQDNNLAPFPQSSWPWNSGCHTNEAACLSNPVMPPARAPHPLPPSSHLELSTAFGKRASVQLSAAKWLLPLLVGLPCHAPLATSSKHCSRSMSHWSRLSIVAARPKPAPMSHSRIVVAFARK